MNILADEGVDRLIVVALRTAGHIVFYVAEMNPGVDDETILAQANADHALLLTADKDFGELVFRLKRVHTGVVLLRLAGLVADAKVELVLRAFQEHADELHGAFCVVTPHSVRVRRPI